jgi:hypothetical protein
LEKTEGVNKDTGDIGHTRHKTNKR